jgi:hypothetical protein
LATTDQEKIADFFCFFSSSYFIPFRVFADRFPGDWASGDNCPQSKNKTASAASGLELYRSASAPASVRNGAAPFGRTAFSVTTLTVCDAQHNVVLRVTFLLLC